MGAWHETCWNDCGIIVGIILGSRWDHLGILMGSPQHTQEHQQQLITSNIAINPFLPELRQAAPSRTIPTRLLSSAPFKRRLKTNYCSTPPRPWMHVFPPRPWVLMPLQPWMAQGRGPPQPRMVMLHLAPSTQESLLRLPAFPYA